MATPENSLLMITGALGVALGVLLELALIVIALTVIRNNRPAAVWPLLGSAGLGILASIVHPLSNLVMGRLLSTDDMLTGLAITNFTVLCVRVLGTALLLYGLVLAARPRHDVA